MISVIIPTIWKCNKFTIPLIESLVEIAIIDEIIIINNNPGITPDGISKSTKIKMLNQSENLYFNPSVNIGVSIAKNQICCVCNDDIRVDTNIFDYVSKNMAENTGAIFISPACIAGETGDKFPGTVSDNPMLIAYDKSINHGPGMLFFVNKPHYIPIPEEMIHWWGDVFVHKIMQHRNKDTFLVDGFSVKTFGIFGRGSGVPKHITSTDTAKFGGSRKLIEFIKNNYNGYTNASQ